MSRLFAALLFSSTVSSAQPLDRTLAVHLDDCVRGKLDEQELDSSLEIETGSAIATGHDQVASYTVSFDCAPTPGVLSVVLRSQGRTAQSLVSFEQVEPASRARAVALVVAERLRALEELAQQSLPVSTSLAKGVLARTIEAPSIDLRRSTSLRRATIALGAGSVATLVLGGVLSGIGSRQSSTGISALDASGIGLMSVAGVAAIAGGVTLGLWLRERHRVSRSTLR